MAARLLQMALEARRILRQARELLEATALPEAVVMAAVVAALGTAAQQYRAADAAAQAAKALP